MTPTVSRVSRVFPVSPSRWRCSLSRWRERVGVRACYQPQRRRAATHLQCASGLASPDRFVGSPHAARKPHFAPHPLPKGAREQDPSLASPDRFVGSPPVRSARSPPTRPSADLAAPGCAVPGTHRDSSIPVDFDRLSVGLGKTTHAPQRRRGRRGSQRNTDWFFLCASSAISAPLR